MRILLDSCTFLWIVLDDVELSPRVRDAHRAPENEVYLSSISTWELVLKHSLGRLVLPAAPDPFLRDQRERHAIEALPLAEEAVVYLPRLPPLHRDPFDRMLVCQAIAHGLTIATPDPLIARYPVPTIW